MPRRRNPERVTKQVTAQTLCVGLVLVPAFPRDAHLQRQPWVVRARLDGAPPDGLAVEVGDKSAGRRRPRVAALGLSAEPVSEFLGADGGPGLAGPHLEPLALAPVRISARAEDRLDVLPARLVGGDDRELGRRWSGAHAGNRSRRQGQVSGRAPRGRVPHDAKEATWQTCCSSTMLKVRPQGSTHSPKTCDRRVTRSTPRSLRRPYVRLDRRGPRVRR